MLLKDVVYKEYLPAKKKKLRGNTIQGYTSSIEKHVIPAFGEYDIEKITYTDVQDWVDTMDAPRGGVIKAYKCLRQIIRWYIIKHRSKMDDPTVGVELPKLDRYEPSIYTRKEKKDFLKGIKGHYVEAVAIVMLDLGLRKCEGFGMQWPDIDFNTGQVHIQRGAHIVHGERVIYPPKTFLSDRVIFLSKKALRRLRKIHKTATSIWLCDERPDVAAKDLKEFAKENDLPWIPMKNFRHTWATHAIEDGESAMNVAWWLGHSNMTMAYTRYAQRTNKAMRKIARRRSRRS